jgi:hypothetical protein
LDGGESGLQGLVVGMRASESRAKGDQRSVQEQQRVETKKVR